MNRAIKENIFILTGRPGIGKTTIIMKLAEELKKHGLSVCGMLTKEIRSAGMRIGFEIIDLSSGKKGLLAKVGDGEPRVGRYVVNLKDLEDVGVKAIEAIVEHDVLLIDEVGPMELKSNRFREVVRSVLKLDKPIVMTIHHKEKDPLLDEIRHLASSAIITVTYENRDSLPSILARRILSIARRG